VNVLLLRRIAEIERALVEQQGAGAEACRRPATELSDSEAIDSFRLLLTRRSDERPAPASPPEEAEIVRRWRTLTA
jgi:hypothetical protein